MISGPCAIVGGAFYNPPVHQFPSFYVGKYFFGDLCGGWIRLMDPANNTASDFATGHPQPGRCKNRPRGQSLLSHTGERASMEGQRDSDRDTDSDTYVDANPHAYTYSTRHRRQHLLPRHQRPPQPLQLRHHRTYAHAYGDSYRYTYCYSYSHPFAFKSGVTNSNRDGYSAQPTPYSHPANAYTYGDSYATDKPYRDPNASTPSPTPTATATPPATPTPSRHTHPDTRAAAKHFHPAAR